jgi:hypothetical protein
MRGDQAKAAEYRKLAASSPARWVKEADDGDHFRLAFDRPGTWSQKYNLVWDRILGLNLFPDAKCARKEMDFYRRIQNTYGLPLDNRSRPTPSSIGSSGPPRSPRTARTSRRWSIPCSFLNETPQRSPMTDWY